MSRFQTSTFQNTLIPSRVTRPRFLRAIPSLVILTTAMAWGIALRADGLGLGGVSTTGVTVAAGPGLGRGVEGAAKGR